VCEYVSMIHSAKSLIKILTKINNNADDDDNDDDNNFPTYSNSHITPSLLNQQNGSGRRSCV